MQSIEKHLRSPDLPLCRFSLGYHRIGSRILCHHVPLDRLIEAAAEYLVNIRNRVRSEQLLFRLERIVRNRLGFKKRLIVSLYHACVDIGELHSAYLRSDVMTNQRDV